MNNVITLAEELGLEPHNPDDQCQDLLLLIDDRGRPMELRCERLIVNAHGHRVEHVHHRRTHDVGGVERAMTTWTRRP
jgi:hypothetical protein